jgi:hypothetical protein
MIVSLYVMCTREIHCREKEDEQNDNVSDDEERDDVDDASDDSQDKEVILVEGGVLADEDKDEGF